MAYDNSRAWRHGYTDALKERHCNAPFEKTWGNMSKITQYNLGYCDGQKAKEKLGILS